MPLEPSIELSGKQVLVLGAGKSGLAAARLAKAHGAVVTLLDSAPATRFASLGTDLAREGISFCPSFQEDNWNGPAVDLVVLSPGIPLGSPLHRLAVGTKAPLMGELEFGAAFLDCPMFAVTGTNGKTTTVELLTACLQAVGKKTLAAGNIGLPLSQVALEQPNLDCIVVEVSSFQLEHAASFHPQAAIVLNITPDHLDRHGTLETYRSIKLRLLNQLRPGGIAVYHSRLESFVQFSNEIKTNRLWFIGEEIQPALRGGIDWMVTSDGLEQLNPDGAHTRLLPRAALKLVGNHNLTNALAVVAVMNGLGYPLEQFRTTLGNFQSGPHRLQLVAEHQGIAFYDDSKATDVDAMKQALRTLGPVCGKKILLIAGGLDKGCALSEAKSELRMYVKGTYLIGACRDRLAALWSPEVPTTVCTSLEAAVQSAFSNALPGDAILLSPACASMDMFRNYEERGNRFRDAAIALASASSQADDTLS